MLPLRRVPAVYYTTHPEAWALVPAASVVVGIYKNLKRQELCNVALEGRLIVLGRLLEPRLIGAYRSGRQPWLPCRAQSAVPIGSIEVLIQKLNLRRPGGSYTFMLFPFS